MKEFDPSHRCILEKWEIVTRMIECREDVEKHLWEFARKVCRRVNERYAGVFQQYDRFDSESNWVEVSPTQFLDWRKSGYPLLSLGVEHVSVDQLCHLGGDDPCWFYVFSRYRDAKANDTRTDQLDSIVKPPRGFERTLDKPHRGYVFTKKVSPLTPNEICDITKLEQYFADPFVTLIEWYKANENTLWKSFDGSRRGKSSN